MTFTPCMSDGGRYYDHEGRACEKCPGVLGSFVCDHDCHGSKRKRLVVRRKPRS